MLLLGELSAHCCWYGPLKPGEFTLSFGAGGTVQRACDQVRHFDHKDRTINKATQGRPHGDAASARLPDSLGHWWDSLLSSKGLQFMDWFWRCSLRGCEKPQLFLISRKKTNLMPVALAASFRGWGSLTHLRLQVWGQLWGHEQLQAN